MARRPKNLKHTKPKTVLRLPDLEQAKRAVLNSLAAASFFTPPLLGDKVSGNPAGC